jgi:class 3 adenylate cyclase
MAERHWVWHFDKPPELAWPILSDTARLNEAAGGPRYAVEEIPQPDGTLRRRAAARVGRFDLSWEERPFEWVWGRRFSQTRIFDKGPFSRLGVALDIAPEGTGTRADYRIQAEPASLLGRGLIAMGGLDRFGRTMEDLARKAMAIQGPIGLFNLAARPPVLAAEAVDRLPGIAAQIEAGPYGHGLVGRLVDHVLTAQDVDLIRLRPLRLARQWGVAPEAAVDLCLAAVPAGLLDLHWDLLCPRCRGAKRQVEALDLLPDTVHCPSCNIDYGRDFARNLELSFTPSPAIRLVQAGEYCLSGPMMTPHVWLQQTLQPGEEREVGGSLRAGSYRARTLEPGGDREVESDGSTFPALALEAGGIRAGEAARPGFVRLANHERAERTVIVEDRLWVADVLTAHRAVTSQAFRDLFAAQAPRPGDEMAVGTVTLMFSDLRGSTALYEAIGDSAAFALVREHFAFLTALVRRHRGAVVKTIGDAVMATFAEPGDAVRAALAVQTEIAAFNVAQAARLAGAPALAIKLGLHAGPAIVVRLNDRLDYFGSTVNLAARIQDLSTGGDVVVSESFAADPSIAPLLAGLAATEERARVKGFGGDIAVRRVRPRQPADSPRTSAMV